MINYELAHKYFEHRKDGFLYWKVNKSPRGKAGYPAGSKAGGVNGSGRYWKVNLNGHPYAAHRVIWLMHYGYIPEHEIDHVDRNPFNNRIENLREVSRVCNMRNTQVPCDNKTGVKGVSWDKSNTKWRADITIHGKRNRLGVYKDFSEAVLARFAAEQCLSWDTCDSSSSAYQYAKKHNLIRC